MFSGQLPFHYIPRPTPPVFSPTDNSRYQWLLNPSRHTKAKTHSIQKSPQFLNKRSRAICTTLNFALFNKIQVGQYQSINTFFSPFFSYCFQDFFESVYRTSFNSSSVDGHLGGFQPFVLTNCAAVNNLPCGYFPEANVCEYICRINSQKQNYWVKSMCISNLDIYRHIALHENCDNLSFSQQQLM